jgi:hypothetical protein
MRPSKADRVPAATATCSSSTATTTGFASWRAPIRSPTAVGTPSAAPSSTSTATACAAGLPIFPGLVRCEEAALGPGGIRHALRFTVSRWRAAYVPPATRCASNSSSADLPPMGMRVRLKASYQIPSGFSAETRVILTAMKTCGMIVADNGSNWYVSGAPDDRWDNDALNSELAQVRGSDFEVVRMDGLVTG